MKTEKIEALKRFVANGNINLASAFGMLDDILPESVGAEKYQAEATIAKIFHDRSKTK